MDPVSSPRGHRGSNMTRTRPYRNMAEATSRIRSLALHRNTEAFLRQTWRPPALHRRASSSTRLDPKIESAASPSARVLDARQPRGALVRLWTRGFPQVLVITAEAASGPEDPPHHFASAPPPKRWLQPPEGDRRVPSESRSRFDCTRNETSCHPMQRGQMVRLNARHAHPRSVKTASRTYPTSSVHRSHPKVVAAQRPTA